jgi:translocation and assembly module TamB
VRLTGDGSLAWTPGSGGAPGTLAGEARLTNATPGRLDDGAMPVARGQGRFAWRAGVLSLSEMRIASPGTGAVSGGARIDFGRRVQVGEATIPALQLALELREVDLASLSARLPAARLSGSARVDDSRLELALSDASRGGASLSAAGTVAGETLRLERLQLRALPGFVDGSADASGSVQLRAPYAGELAGSFKGLDPAALAARLADGPPARLLSRLAGRIDGRWSLRGPLRRTAGEAALALRFDVTGGSLAGLATRAGVQASVGDARVFDVDATLALGRTRLSARGALGAPADRLAFELGADALAQLAALLEVPGLEGALRASGELRGAIAAPALSVEGSATGIALGATARAASLSGSVALPSLAGALDAASVAARIDAKAVRVGTLQLAGARASVTGSARAHEFEAQLSAPAYELRMKGAGALAAGPQWSGTLRELGGTGELDLRSEQPVALEVRKGRASIGATALRSRFGELRIARAEWSEGRFAVDADAQVTKLASLAQALGVQVPGTSQQAGLEEIVLQARASLSGTSRADVSGALALRMRGAGADAAHGDLELTLRDGGLDGTMDLRVPTLAFANRIVGPEWALDGRLRVSGRVAGTALAPRLDAELSGEALSLEQRAMGWRLRDGTLSGRFDGERFRLSSLRLVSGAASSAAAAPRAPAWSRVAPGPAPAASGTDARTGTVEIDGELRLTDNQGRFRLVADRLNVPIGPGQRVVLSGSADLVSQARVFELKGSLRADEGLIELRGGEAPSLPEDIVIVDRRAAEQQPARPGADGARRNGDAPRAGGAEAEPFRIGADLSLDLGDQLRVRGSGVDARLSGSLNLRGTLPDAPRAYGTVRVRDGRYTAYGQQLEITRGRVVFNGPLDNPVLDIVALRRNQAVEAGVSLTGTVLSPRVRLVSQPDVPDSEKLSWLVLGVPLGNAESQAQGAALQAAAATMFGSNDGGLTAELTRAFGLDSLSIRPASGTGGLLTPGLGGGGFGTPLPPVPGQASGGASAQSGAASQNVVAVGKRLSSNVYVTYEQALRGVWNLLRIQYDISNRLSVRAQTGSETAFDVLYRYSFD